MDTTRRDNVACVGVAFAFALGCYARFLAVLNGDFPLNDGGLFYIMAQEVRAAHYHLPVVTSYNAAHIPFAYPPFAFYLAAALADLTGANLLTVLRFLPAVLSALSIPAFYLFCRDFLQSRTPALYATCIFALLPRAYAWMVMGGGLTRAPGYTFAIFALAQAYLLYTRREPRFILTTTLGTTLTTLTHAEMTWFIVYSIVLMWLFYGRDLKTFGDSAIVLAGTTLLTAPWWFTVISRFGLAPYAAAAQTGGKNWFTFYPNRILGEPFFPILAYVALVGLIAYVQRKQYFLPAWVLLIFLVQPRSARNLVSLPLAIALGLALDSVILPALERFNHRATPQPAAGDTIGLDRPNRAPDFNLADVRPSGTYRLGRLQVMVLSAVLFYVLFCAWLTSAWAPQLKTLSLADRAAMQWVPQHTPADSRFVLLTPDAFWDDSVAEWFPALAQRVSVATVQGSEWLPNHRFYQLWRRADDLNACSKRDGPGGLACVENLMRPADATYSHIYIRKELEDSDKKVVWAKVTQALRTSPAYTLIYDGPGALIFARHKAVP